MRIALLAAAVVLTGAAALSLGKPAEAASFDCRRAGTGTERAICANLGLNDRDVRMAQLYDITRRLVPMGGRGAIMDRQVSWIRERNRCGADVGCIGRSYDRRIGELNSVMERVYRQGPF